jgi:epoxyqueuosine reductase
MGLLQRTRIERERVRELARTAGLSLAAVGPAESFDSGLEAVLIDRIRNGHLDGFTWFTEERARFSTSPRNLHSSARSIISVGVPYWMPDIQHPDDGIPRGRISRYAWGRDYHKTLKQRMKHFHELLETEIGSTIEARLLVDTARVVDRAIAARSGLGWYGKNTMIISPRRGSWLMLGEVIVDIDIEHDVPMQPKCGRCTRCLDVCPTGALVDEYTLHTPLCISFQTIESRESIPRNLRPLVKDWVFGCDMCQDICPFTNAAKPVDEPSFVPKTIDHAFPPLRWLISMTEAEFRAEFSGTAVMRAKWSGMVRNALVAIGNIGTTGDLDLLERTARYHELPIAREHAVWAMRRIDSELSRPALEALSSIEKDHAVRSEIEHVLTQSS